MGELFASFCTWLVNTIEAWGYPGIMLLMAIESSVIPLPSEGIIPPAGYLISAGKMSWTFVILAGAFGSLLGAYANYFASQYLGRPILLRYGKYFFLSESKLVWIEKFFAQHGEIATFIGRLIPGARHVISIPAGLARMNLWRFTAYTLLGAGIWSAVLAYIGYLVGSDLDKVRQYMHTTAGWLAVILLVMVAGYVKLHQYRKRKSALRDDADEKKTQDDSLPCAVPVRVEERASE